MEQVCVGVRQASERRKGSERERIFMHRSSRTERTTTHLAVDAVLRVDD